MGTEQQSVADVGHRRRFGGPPAKMHTPMRQRFIGNITISHVYIIRQRPTEKPMSEELQLASVITNNTHLILAPSGSVCELLLWRADRDVHAIKRDTGGLFSSFNKST